MLIIEKKFGGAFRRAEKEEELLVNKRQWSFQMGNQRDENMSIVSVMLGTA